MSSHHVTFVRLLQLKFTFIIPQFMNTEQVFLMWMFAVFVASLQGTKVREVVLMLFAV